jgi:hypothetical protein
MSERRTWSNKTAQGKPSNLREKSSWRGPFKLRKSGTY